MEKLEKYKFVYDKLCAKISFFQTIQTIFCKKKNLSKIGQDQKLINLPELVYYEKS